MNAGDLGSVPGLGRPLGEGNGYSLQYCGLENSTDSSTGSHRVGHTERLSLHLTYLKVWLLWHVPNSFKFSSSLRDVLRGDGSCRRHEAGHLCPWARTQARAIRGFTSSHPGQRLNPLAYRQAGAGRASPGASSGRFSPRKFSCF